MEKLLSVSELASALGVNEETVRRLTRSGELPCTKVGKSVRYRLSDIVPASPAPSGVSDLLKAGLGVCSTDSRPAFLEAIAMSLGFHSHGTIADHAFRIADALERIASALENRGHEKAR